jgi:hypothetical protein
VGPWVPEQKHRYVFQYLYATQHAWGNWHSRAFIDPFCGPGRIQVTGKTSTRDGGALVAWRTPSRRSSIGRAARYGACK